MSEVSVAQAKARFAELVHQAEAGQPVRISRCRRAVAVLVSTAVYACLSSLRTGLLAYTAAWRAQMQDAGLALADDGLWLNLRDQTDRTAPDLA